MEKKIISLDGKKVRTTSDLEQFIFRKDINRKISRTNVDNIKKQILNKSHLIVPVLVSDKNEILDGQNRVVAVKELVEEHKFDSNKDIELPYIVISYAQMEEAGVTIEDIIEGINSAGSNWNNSDKLKLASRNNSNITTLLELKAYFKLPTNIIFAILTGEFVQANMVVSKMQENDSIKLDFNDCIEQVGEFAKKFARMKIINSDIGTKVYESFIKISSESEITDLDFEKITKVLQKIKYGMLTSRSNGTTLMFPNPNSAPKWKKLFADILSGELSELWIDDEIEIAS